MKLTQHSYHPPDTRRNSNLFLPKLPPHYITSIFSCVFSSVCSVDENNISKQFNIVPESDIDLSFSPVIPEYARRSTAEIVADEGYESQIHYAVAEDGFMLELVRIEGQYASLNYPVLLVHGLLFTSAMWLYAGREMNLAYKLVDQGTEVWLATFRGGRGSQRHKTLSVDTDEYWNFGYDEVAKFDIPAIIEYVLHASGKEKVNYIGHSMGGSVYFAMCNYKPDLCMNGVNLMIGLGTHATVHSMNSPAPRYLSKSYTTLYGRTSFRNTYGSRSFLPLPDLMRDLASKFCTYSLHSAGMCRMGLFLIVGPTDLNVTMESLGYLMANYPSTTSVKLLEHYIQFISRKQWAKFDYESIENFFKYGTIYPPSYSLSYVTTPVALFHSDWDMFCSPKDTAFLIRGLPNLVYEKNMNRTWYSHGDYMYNADISLLHSSILQLLKENFTLEASL